MTDQQVTTFVRELDTQGPVVVQRITTEVGGLACTPETVESLVDALHNGSSVTITADGKSATFNAAGAHLGYGEAYIALSLAAQELRHAGITSCATPAQWQAVLLGGPLQTTVTSTTTTGVASAGTAATFPGIVTLHRQGQGWGEIAQSTNLQLSSIVNSSQSSSTTASNANPSSNSTLSPTGYSSADMNKGRSTAADKKKHKDHDNDQGQNNDDQGQDKDHDKDKIRDDTSKPEQNPATTSDKLGYGK